MLGMQLNHPHAELGRVLLAKEQYSGPKICFDGSLAPEDAHRPKHYMAGRPETRMHLVWRIPP